LFCALYIGPAKEALLELAEQGEKVDLVFMDSDKDGYVEYLQVILILL